MLGARGRNRALGLDATAGTRVWDQQGAFEVALGPLTFGQFQDFLPTGWAFHPLCDLTRFYVAKTKSTVGDTILNLAWERALNTGSANIDFEINRNTTANCIII